MIPSSLRPFVPASLLLLAACPPALQPIPKMVPPEYEAPRVYDPGKNIDSATGNTDPLLEETTENPTPDPTPLPEATAAPTAQPSAEPTAQPTADPSAPVPPAPPAPAPTPGGN